MKPPPPLHPLLGVAARTKGATTMSRHGSLLGLCFCLCLCLSLAACGSIPVGLNDGGANPDKKANPANCSNGAQDGDETDVDCGGFCSPCAGGKHCNDGPDCDSGTCVNRKCLEARCDDRIKNGQESDVDCGGMTCPKCPGGKVCMDAGDCVSAMCVNNMCSSAIDCMPPLANCDGVPASGCNIDTSSDPSNCGLCGLVCPMDTPTCAAGVCKGSRCPNALMFAPVTIYKGGREVYGVGVGDLNGDGKPDIAAVNDGDNNVSVFNNQGQGMFNAKIDYAAGDRPYGVVIADLSADGKNDMVVAGIGGTGLLVNQGGGAFAAPMLLAPSSNDIVLRDLNKDGKLDIAVASQNYNG